jgi:general secretion pathway protein A
MDTPQPQSDGRPSGEPRAPGYFHRTPTHEEALARLHFLVEHRCRLGLLMGGRGSGKSLTLELFARQLCHRNVPVAKLGLLGMERAEFLWTLSAGLGAHADAGQSMSRLWRIISDRIAEHRYQDLPTVVLLDDADRAGRDVLVQVTRLAKHGLECDLPLTLVLAGQTARMGRVGRDLLEMAQLRIDLEPWELADTEGYLRASQGEAGRPALSFPEPAVARLHDLAQGIPRRVAQMADLVCWAALGSNVDSIGPETVDSACQELGVVELGEPAQNGCRL